MESIPIDSDTVTTTESDGEKSTPQMSKTNSEYKIKCEFCNLETWKKI